MSEVNSKKMFYRLRSLKSIFEYKELENQEIYFASLDELNDPMEGFRNVVFKGDKIVWRNLLRHYLKCLNWACMINCASNGKYDFWGDSRFPLYECIEDFPDSFHENFFGESYQDFIQAFNRVMDKLSTITTVSRSEILHYLERIHYVACKIISKMCPYRKQALIKEANEIIEMIENHENFKNQKLEMEALSIFDIFQGWKNSMQLDIVSKNNRLMNQSFIDFNFVDFYLQRLEKLMYPECYVACFMEEANNSSVWGHYGDGHRGICLVFETENNSLELYSNNKKQERQDKSSKYYLKKINYDNSYNEINFFETIRTEFINDWHIDEKGNKSQMLDNSQNKDKQIKYNLYDTLLHKTQDWEHESEYRIIDEYSHNTIDKETRKLKYNFKNLNGIIFGMRTSLRDKTKIINIIKQKCKNEKREDFNFYQAYYCQKDKQIKHSLLDISLQEEPSDELLEAIREV